LITDPKLAYKEIVQYSIDLVSGLTYQSLATKYLSIAESLSAEIVPQVQVMTL
jgi:hypothetical protein